MSKLLFVAMLMTASLTIGQSVASAAGSVASDDFSGAGLDTGLWTVVDPVGDGSVSTDGSRLLLGVPGGVNHNAWSSNTGLRAMQSVDDTDVEVELKFESAVTSTYQSQGVLFEESDGSYVRVDLYSDGGDMRGFVSTFVNGSASVKSNAVVGPVGSSPVWLRVNRTGNSWTASSSSDGVSFAAFASFSHAMTVSSVGPFAGNYGAPAPAFTAVVDYFFNTASPIVPEDDGAAEFFSVGTSASGSGSVVLDPAGGTYAAGSVVSVSAVPDAGWEFVSWGGDLSGGVNPESLTVDADKSVTATFALADDETPPVVSDVAVSAASTSATVSWSTDEPATGAVEFGLTVGHELGSVAGSGSAMSQSVVLSGLEPETTYHYAITATDAAGNATVSGDATFVTAASPPEPPAPSGSVVSDDFAGGGLNTGLWAVVDPVGDGSVTTDGSRLLLGVPGGVDHNAWSPNTGLRVMQSVDDADVEVELKFESAVSSSYQSQGVLFEESDGSYVRVDLYFDGSNTRGFASSFVNGSASVKANAVVGSAGSPVWLRVNRTGNSWTASSSSDGVSFAAFASFSHAMTVSSVGPFAGNFGSPAPAFTAVVDYFFNTASPIDPEDGTAVEFFSVSTSASGSGSVVLDPAGGSYASGSVVSVSAVPDAGYEFVSWGGDLSGGVNPESLTVDADKSVTATFALADDETPPVVSGVDVVPTSTSATVSWSTDEPATGAVEFGLTAGHELGSVAGSGSAMSQSVVLSGLEPDTTYHYAITATDTAGNQTTTVDATFVTLSPDTYTLTSSVVGSGSVQFDPAGGVYADGTSVTITAVPAANWSFVGWSGDASGTANPVTIVVTQDSAVTATFEEVPNGEAPVIDVWYGDTQTFGAIGTPQNYANVFGNVADPDGVADLTYSLNGGSNMPLSIGPDFRRLQEPGDFNADIHISSLVAGANQVVIRAVDGLGNVATHAVQLDYTPGTVWPLPYSVDWSSASEISDVAQVVDGKWEITPAGLRTTEPGYDRLVAIGDMTWQSYELTVPVTVHEFDEAGAGPYSDLPVIGVLMRWQGHTDDPLGGQPLAGYRPNGNIAYVRDGQSTWYAPSGGQQPIDMQLEVEHTYKVRVLTNGDGTSTYSLKVWASADPEPAAWQSVTEGPSDLQTGSLLLLAHHVDATFGNLSITPLSSGVQSYSVGTSASGSGSVVLSPAGGTYTAGSVVSVEAVPAAGWEFVSWSGDLSGGVNPESLTVDANKSVTATFALVDDETPPVVSNVAVSAASTSATVSWSTDEPATGAVEFGLTAGHELGSVSGSGSAMSQSVVLSGLEPETTYHYAITATDAAGNATVSGDATFVTAASPPAPSGSVVSDDFSGGGLNTGLWGVVDPVGDGSVTTDGSRLLLGVPGGVNHNAWSPNTSLRVMQSVTDADFEVELKFESAVTSTYQSQGVLFEESDGSYVRVDLLSQGGDMRGFVSTFVNGSASVKSNAVLGPVGSSPVWLRVNRTGNSWTASSSSDGVSFAAFASFSHAMTVSSVGPFAGNYGAPAPAFTAVVDYFFNTASPIDPEDG